MATTTTSPGAPDLRTPSEIARDKVRDAICKDFIELYTADPTVSPNRYIKHIAAKYDKAPEGVKWILAERGIYRSNMRHPIIVISAAV